MASPSVWHKGCNKGVTLQQSPPTLVRHHAENPRHPRKTVHSPLEPYLHDLNKTPLLSAEEEKKLAYRIEEGDAAARDHLIRADLRLVVNIARHYVNSGLSLDDLISEGNLGLMRAAEGFDPSLDTRFSTYACYWIRQSIKRAILNTGKTIRIPAYMNDLMAKWRRATSELQNNLGRPPSHEEVGRRLGLGPKKLRIIKKAILIYNGRPQTGHEENDGSIDETWIDPKAAAPDDSLMRKDDMGQVLELVHELGEREATVLRMRYGLDGEEPCTLKEIGDRLGLTRERVRQIEKESLQRLGEMVG